MIEKYITNESYLHNQAISFLHYATMKYPDSAILDEGTALYFCYGAKYLQNKLQLIGTYFPLKDMAQNWIEDCDLNAMVTYQHDNNGYQEIAIMFSGGSQLYISLTEVEVIDSTLYQQGIFTTLNVETLIYRLLFEIPFTVDNLADLDFLLENYSDYVPEDWVNIISNNNVQTIFWALEHFEHPDKDNITSRYEERLNLY